MTPATPDRAPPCLPPHDLATAQALIAAVRERAARLGLTVAEPPPEPVGCCGRGCEGCVWLGWFGALAHWHDRVLVTLV